MLASYNARKMSELLHDPAHWRAMAEQHRKLALDHPDPEARRVLVEIAKSYEQLANRAEQRRKALPH
jgi:hypothetical protein